jgi:transposase
MRRLQIANPIEMTIALQEEIQRSDEARYDHRLHGVLLVSQGLSCYEVAQLLGQNPRTVERWVEHFNEHGFAGLQEGERSGRPRQLTQRQWAEVEKALRKSPRDLGLEQTMWDGKMLSYWLNQRFKVKLGVRQCQRMFRQMGFRRRKPRPMIAQADPAAQAAFKKTPSLGRRSCR